MDNLVDKYLDSISSRGVFVEKAFIKSVRSSIDKTLKKEVNQEEDKYIIDTRKPEQQNFTLEADDIKKAYDIYLKPDKKGEAFVLLAYTDEFVKKIYFDLCRYYISGKDQNSTEIYSSKRADILRALKILEN